MAARSPTAFGTYNDGSTIRPRAQILTTEPDAVADDQEMCLDVENLLLSDFFFPIQITGDTSWHTLRYYYIDGRNLCGVASTETSYFTIFAWCSQAVNFSVGIYDSGGGVWVAHAVSSSQTSKVWRGWTPGGGRVLTLNTDATENTIQLGAALDGYTGTEKLWVAGIGIFSG